MYIIFLNLTTGVKAILRQLYHNLWQTSPCCGGVLSPWGPSSSSPRSNGLRRVWRKSASLSSYSILLATSKKDKQNKAIVFSWLYVLKHYEESSFLSEGSWLASVYTWFGLLCSDRHCVDIYLVMSCSWVINSH